jgi:class 3 adenylate cyclase
MNAQLAGVLPQGVKLASGDLVALDRVRLGMEGGMSATKALAARSKMTRGRPQCFRRPSLFSRALLAFHVHRFRSVGANPRGRIAVWEIAEWLAKLGLSEYAQQFAENDIDVTMLGELTDQDLKELGVASLGHRRKILRAIAALDVVPTASAPAQSGLRASAIIVPSVTPVSPPSPASEAVGERRYLTVMFCALVGSTAISAQLDAEEWRDLVGSYLDAASAAVTEMGGHVAKKLGDGILALFGYPVAHENDAERAELNRNIAGTGKPELQARIGLETGPAVLDAAGEIYGDVANIAARVQALAEPGVVLFTGSVQRQIAGLFVAEERGAHELKGLKEPVTLFRLVRASGGGSRSSQRAPTPLVGRRRNRDADEGAGSERGKAMASS